MASDVKKARELERERAQNEKAVKGPVTLGQARARLYDKIKKRVSVGAMNAIVYVIAALILILLIVGIATGQHA